MQITYRGDMFKHKHQGEDYFTVPAHKFIINGTIERKQQIEILFKDKDKAKSFEELLYNSYYTTRKDLSNPEKYGIIKIIKGKIDLWSMR